VDWADVMAATTPANIAATPPETIHAQMEVMARRIRLLEAQAVDRTAELREVLGERDRLTESLSDQSRLYEADLTIACRALRAIAVGDDGSSVIAADALANLPLRHSRSQ